MQETGILWISRRKKEMEKNPAVKKWDAGEIVRFLKDIIASAQLYST